MRCKFSIWAFLITLLFFFNPSVGQKNDVSITKTGDNSKVIIVQNGVYQEFNLNSAVGFNKLIERLSLLSIEFKNLFDNLKKSEQYQFNELQKGQKKIVRRQDEIKNKIDSLPQTVLRGLLSDTNSVSLLKLEINIRELEQKKAKLENELVQYRLENPTFASLIDSANKKLKEYDFYGYHTIMENFINKSITNAARGCYLRAKTYETNFQFAEAFIQMERASSFDSSNRQYLLECANLAGKIGNNHKVLFYYNKALSNKDINLKQRSEVLESLGRFYSGINIDSAFYYFKTAEAELIKNFPNDTLFTLIRLGLLKTNLGELLLRMGMYEEAVKEFEFSIFVSKTTSKSPDNILAAVTYEQIGYAYSTIKSFDSAKVNFEKAIKIYIANGISNYYDRTAKLYNQLGNNYFKERFYDSSITCYKKASILYEKYTNNNHPIAGVVLSNLGIAYLNKNDKGEALKYLREAEKKLSNFPFDGQAVTALKIVRQAISMNW